MMGNLPRADITGLILSGGRGSRMGGADKGLQPFQGKPLLTHAIQRLASQVGELAVNANRNLDAYRALGLPVWTDASEGFFGPLAGMQAGLAHCKTPYLAIVPCDCPILPLDLVSRLAQAMLVEQAQAAMAQTEENGAPRVQPVFCLLKAELLSSLNRYLESGGAKTGVWLSSIPAARAVFTENSAFANINTPEELDAAG